MTNENTGVTLEYTKEFEYFWARVADQIDGFYIESELPALKERMSNYFADFPYLEELDDITKDDIVELLFSKDYYADR